MVFLSAGKTESRHRSGEVQGTNRASLRHAGTQRSHRPETADSERRIAGRTLVCDPDASGLHAEGGSVRPVRQLGQGDLVLFGQTPSGMEGIYGQTPRFPSSDVAGESHCGRETFAGLRHAPSALQQPERTEISSCGPEIPFFPLRPFGLRFPRGREEAKRRLQNSPDPASGKNGTLRPLLSGSLGYESFGHQLCPFRQTGLSSWSLAAGCGNSALADASLRRRRFNLQRRGNLHSLHAVARQKRRETCPPLER